MKIWGNGGIIISDVLGVYTVSFNNAQCKLSFKLLSILNITIDTCIHRTNIKYRPYITAIITVCEGDESNLQQLIYCLNEHYNIAGTAELAIIPRYSEDNSLQIYYYCVLLSTNVLPKNLANTKVGQLLLLTFKGSSVDYMPYFTSELTVFNIIDASGEQYIDASSNEYIMYA